LFKGQLYEYGPVSIQGLTKFKPITVKRRLQFKEGETFKRDDLDSTRKALTQTGWFKSVMVVPVAPNDDTFKESSNKPQKLPIKVKVQEDAPRRLDISLSYVTGNGAQGEAGLSHNNLAGQGERGDIRAIYSQRLRKYSLFLAKPDIRNILNSQVFVRLFFADMAELPYFQQAYVGEIGLKWPIRDKLSIGASLGFEQAYLINRQKRNDKRPKVYPKNEETTNQAGFLKLKLEYNQTTSPLAKKEGFDGVFDLTYYMGKMQKYRHALVSELRLNYYHNFSDKFSAYLWSDLGYGWFFQPQMENDVRPLIPAHKRFYPGGARSVRGYSRMGASYLNRNGIPLGAQGVIEGGIEFSYKFKEPWGALVFVDAARLIKPIVDETSPTYPKEKNYFMSFGIGAQYHTSFGPVSLRIAFPTRRRPAFPGMLEENKKKKFLDSAFQILFSLGIQS